MCVCRLFFSCFVCLLFASIDLTFDSNFCVDLMSFERIRFAFLRCIDTVFLRCVLSFCRCPCFSTLFVDLCHRLDLAHESNGECTNCFGPRCSLRSLEGRPARIFFNPYSLPACSLQNSGLCDDTTETIVDFMQALQLLIRIT